MPGRMDTAQTGKVSALWKKVLTPVKTILDLSAPARPQKYSKNSGFVYSEIIDVLYT